jgi:hypothetical protein
MSIRLKAAATTLAVAVPAFLAAPILFPPPPGPPPTSTQLVSLEVLTASDSLLLGMGIAFVGFGWPLVRHAAGSRVRASAMFLAIAWLTISWYPHVGLHGSAFGATLPGVLAIDYGFHVPLYLTAVVLIWGLLGYLRDNAPSGAAPAPMTTRSAAGHPS